jgi:hypothetical protein
LADEGKWAADYYDLLWFVMIFPLMDELSKAKKEFIMMSSSTILPNGMNKEEGIEGILNLEF